MSAGPAGRVAVVGAGSSGLAAVKNLRERGFAVDCFERAGEVGGNWNFGAPTSRVYASTYTISSKPFTQYVDFPMPDDFPDYPHHTQIRDYLHAYADHFGLRRHVACHSEVVRLEPVPDGGSWDVTVQDGSGRRTSRYDAVVIANGHNWVPKVPDYPGSFTGEVRHAADYQGPEMLRGRRVLVVGAGNTGCDLAVEAAQHAAATFHSARRGYWYAPKYVFGRPADQVNDLVLGLRLPLALRRALFQATLRATVGPPQRYGLPRPDHRIYETHPIVNSLLLYYVGHGAIRPKPDVARFDGDGVVFADGSREQVDLVLLCTGYLARFPFVDEAHLNWRGDRPVLYQNVFTPRHDNLCVAGLVQPDSGQFTLVHWQTVAIAELLVARRERPERARELLRRAAADTDHVYSAGTRYATSSRHYFEVAHHDYLRGLERTIEILTGRPVRAVRPFEWALPPRPATREVRSAHPAAPTGRPPLLFVPDAGEDAGVFASWLDQAAERGFPAYAVSLRGHGASSGGHRARHRPTLRDYTHDVVQAAVGLPAPPVLVGRGLGAQCVTRAMARYPARAGVLLGPAPRGVLARPPAPPVNAAAVHVLDRTATVADVLDWVEQAVCPTALDRPPG